MHQTHFCKKGVDEAFEKNSLPRPARSAARNNEKPRNRDGFRAFDDGARYRTRIDPTPYQPVLSGIEKYRE